MANSAGAVVLPFPKYANYDHQHDPKASSFLHFIGAYRFDNDFFAQQGQRVIDALMTP